MIISKSFSSTLIAVITGAFLLISGCGGGSGGGGGGGVNLPTPTLPTSAVTITTANADAIAISALDFTDIFFVLFGLKTEAPPSIPDVIQLITDQVIKRDRSLRSVVTGVTEDLSSFFCVTGTATATYTETANSETGTISFSTCDLGGGMLLGGSISYNFSWNDINFNYDSSFGGTLTFDFGADNITIVVNLGESGNDDTGAYSATISYSLSGVPDGDFLVTTPIAWVGNSILFQVYSGQLLIQGANNTWLRITVSSTNVGTIELDDGGGVFVEIDSSPISLYL